MSRKPKIDHQRIREVALEFPETDFPGRQKVARLKAIGRHLGISSETVSRALDPSIIERNRHSSKRYDERRRRDPATALLLRLRTNASKRKERLSSSQLTEIVDSLLKTPVCYLTGTELNLESGDEYEIDHIVSVAKGGRTTRENLALALSSANKAKGDLSVPAFLELCIRVLEHHGYTVSREKELRGVKTHPAG